MCVCAFWKCRAKHRVSLVRDGDHARGDTGPRGGNQGQGDTGGRRKLLRRKPMIRGFGCSENRTFLSTYLFRGRKSCGESRKTSVGATKTLPESQRSKKSWVPFHFSIFLDFGGGRSFSLPYCSPGSASPSGGAQKTLFLGSKADCES